MRPNYWGDVPINRGLYYNNDQQIGQVLHRLIKSKKNPNVISVRSDSQSVTDGAIMHLSTMLAEFFDIQTEVFWFIGYPNSGFRDLGISLRRFLLQLWQKQDIRIIGEKEFSALSYELTSGSNPHEYFKLNLAALASRIPNLSILLVVDLQQTSNTAYNEIRTLIGDFVEWTSKKEWTGAIIISSSNSPADSDVKFTAPTDEISNLLNSYRTQGEPTEKSIFADGDIADAARLIHPLILLGQPAQRTVLDYVIAHYPQAQDDVRTLLIKKDALWQLNGDAVRVSPRSIAYHAAQFSADRWSAIGDTIPNGAKILAFQGVDRLITQLTGLNEIDAMDIEATRLVDLFALAVAQKRQGGFSFKDTTRQLISNLKSQDYKHHFFRGDHSKSIICYASQMLITQADQFGEDFFSLLESLTYAHADSLRLSSNESISSVYEASRWVTNLGFVYNHICRNLPRAIPTKSGTKSAKIYGKAASYLLNLNPKDKREWANIRYDEAWHLKDAGDIARSTEIFLATAEDIIRLINSTVMTDETFKVIATELTVHALVISPKKLLSEITANFLTQTLDDYGSTLQLDKIISGITNEQVLVDEPGVLNGLAADFVIVSGHVDMHIALLVAKGLRRLFHRITKVVLLPDNRKINVTDYIDQMDAIVIGGPDTPGLNSFVTSYDAELARLYSIKILGDFAISTNSSPLYPKLHVLSSDGLIGNYEAWGMFLDRQQSKITKPERCPMDQIIFEFLIRPLISAAEGRVFNEFINAIGRRLKRKKVETIEALESFKGVNDDRAKDVLAHIDVDVKTVLMEASTPAALADTLDEVMQTLRSVELSPQQLLAIASLAYDMSVNAHRNTVTGSTEEIKLSRYVQGFRNQRSEADELLQGYKATSDIDKNRFNQLAEKLAKALRNFKDSANNNFLS